MKKIILISLIAFIAVSCKQKTIKVQYPETKTVEHVDVYFGTEVADPYRWLEDDLSDETAEWVKAENEVTYNYLSQIPFRDDIREALTKIWNYPKEGTPFKSGNYYFMYKNDGLQNQSVLYIMDELDGEPRAFLDPNTMSDKGTVALSGMSISNDYKYMAYSVSAAGSDWREIRVREIATGNDLPDVLNWVKFSGMAWYQDGFFYSRYDAPEGSALSAKNTFAKVYYHKLGTAQKDDKLIFEDSKNAMRYYYAGTTDDERYLFLSISGGTSGNALAIKELNKPNSTFRTIVPGMEKEYNIIENIGNEILVLTNEDAPRYKVIKCNPTAKNISWETVIPESPEDVLVSASVVGEKIVVKYLHNAYSKLCIFDLNGNLEHNIELPEIGTVGSISGNKGENELFYSFTSFTTVNDIYRLDVSNPIPELYKSIKLNTEISKYKTEQIFFESKDGTKVPMFLVYKEGLKKDGKNPTLLYGYGGFNATYTPSFSVSNILFLENGGIYVLANIRGGGEFGEQWHKAGTKMQKQNVFDDFIAAAEYLIKEKYTSPEKLAIRGGSNGGLLVGACMIQRPDLFKVALPAVGVMDMLRFHKFTVGWGWVGDYGSSEDSEEMFKYLLGYSPLHTLKEGVCYPATLVTTGDHDDRVVPAHSFKFAATLQQAQACDNPVLIRIETQAGHGAGKPTAKVIDEATDMWAFTFYNLGMKYKK